jgi:hypothetical protein
MTPLGAAPALPLHTAGPYVAAAYIVFVVLVIAYIAIIALRTTRTERALDELRRDALARRQEDAATSPGAHEPGAHEPDAEKEPVA